MNNGHSLNVLLVDENEHDYIITRNLLAKIKDWQFNIEWVSSYDNALEKVSNGSYELCLFNYENKGQEFLKHTLNQGIKIPLVSLTESEDRQLVTEAMQFGAVDYLVKSQMTVALLKRVIRYAIQYNQLMAANSQLQQEVTETKKAEAELRERSRQYQMLFDINIYAVEVLDARGVAIDCNPMYQKLVGYSRAEIIGQPTTAFMSDRSQKLLSRKLEALREQSFIEGEAEFIRKDGTKVVVWRRARAIFGNNGTMTGMVAYSRDITERMKAVKQISILARALEQSSVAVLIADHRGRIEYINFEFTEMTGYIYEDVVGQHIRAFKLKHMSRELYEELWETINAGDEWKGEFENFKKNDDKYWESITLTPIFSSRGQLTHFVVTQEDITHRVHDEAEFLQSQQRMGHLMTGQIEDLTSLTEKLQQEIAERERIEKSLRRSRARLKAQYKGIPVPTYSWQITGDDFTLVDYNHAAERTSHGRVTDILGKKASEVFSDRPQVRADFERCAAERRIIRREAPYKLISTGETRHFVTTYNFVPPNLIIVHIEDITQHKQAGSSPETSQQIEDLKTKHATELEKLKQAMRQEIAQREKIEQSLRDKEAQVKELASNIDDRLKEQYRGIPIPTYSWQMIAGKFVLVDFNDAAAASMGKIVDFYGKTADEVFKDRPQVLLDFQTCFDEKRTVRREAPYKLVTSGETRFFVTTYIYTPPNLVIVHIQDITEYKAVEQDLDKANHQLELLSQEYGPRVVEIANALHKEIKRRQELEQALDEAEERLNEAARKSDVMLRLTEVETALKKETHKRQKLEKALADAEAHMQQLAQTSEASPEMVSLEKALEEEIARRQQLEEELKKAAERLKEIGANIDNRLKEQYRGIPVPTYSWQRIADEFILVDFNDAAAEAMGKIVDFYGKPANEIFKDRPQVLQDFETCFEEKRTVVREAPYQLVTSGETRFFVTTYLYLPPNLVIVHIQDITEYKKLAAELESYRQQTPAVDASLAEQLAQAQTALNKETAKRKRIEKLLDQSEKKLKQTSHWLKAMAEEHTVELDKVNTALQQEIKARHDVEESLYQLKTEMQTKQKEDLLMDEQADMDALAMMNEQLQRELGQLQQAEEAIRQNRARLKAQYKGIPIPTYSWQRAGDDFILVDYNDAAEKASQSRIFDLMGTPASEAFKNRPQILEDFNRCFTNKKTIKREAPYQLVPTEDDRFFVSTYNFVPPNLVIVYIQDITAQKKTEEALQRSEEQIALHCRYSRQAVLTFANDAYCWYFNQDREQVIGKFVPFVHQDDLSKVKEHFAALNDEHNSVGAIEYRVVKPDGSLRWQQWITLPIFDQEGRLIEVQGVGRDITRRRQVNEM